MKELNPHELPALRKISDVFFGMSDLGADLQALLSKCNSKVMVLNIMLEALNGFLIWSGLGGDWKGEKLKYEADVVLQML
jgi:hypothetical protein